MKWPVMVIEISSRIKLTQVQGKMFKKDRIMWWDSLMSKKVNYCNLMA